MSFASYRILTVWSNNMYVDLMSRVSSPKISFDVFRFYNNEPEI